MFRIPQTDDEGCTRGKPVDLRFLRRREWYTVIPEEVWPLLHREIPQDEHMTIDDIATGIRQIHVIGGLALIGVEGYGGSGKTTCARHLADALGSAYVVSLDDFIVKERLTDTAWDKGVFDHERLERQVLLPASSGQPVLYQRLEWVTNTLSAPLLVPDADYLIVEGITAYHPTIERYYAYKIWIDIPIEIAQARGHARDGSAENAIYWDQWAKNDIAYQQQYHPERRADYCFVNW